VISCLIADDQAMVREGFGALLAAQPGITVAGLAADGAQAVALARQTRPDVVLMDVRMPVLDGLQATRELLRAASHESAPRVLMLTTFDLDEYVYEALRAGASGFLLKDAPAAELVHAVRVVAAGEALLAPSVTRRLIADFAKRPRPAAPGHARPGDPIAQLTPREAEVLTLIARGLSNAEISASLVIAEQTTKTHVGRILMKLGLRDRAQAVVFAYESGLVTPGDLECFLHLQRRGRVAEAVVQGAGDRVLAVYVESDGRHAPCARLGLSQQHRRAPVPAAAVRGLDLDVVHPGHRRVVRPGHCQPERPDRLVPGQHPEYELSRRVPPGGELARGVPAGLLPRVLERQGARGGDQLGVPGHLPRQPFVVLSLCRRPHAERVVVHRDI